jgi:16S rRNA (adenine1518-N6/adenine1519-N6)-dimethyltransferase
MESKRHGSDEQAIRAEVPIRIRPRKSLGQNFLMDRSVAIIESELARGKNVIELGPGLGILTAELCRTAKHVLAVEKDTRLYDYLKERLECANLDMENRDFFDLGADEVKDCNMLVSNVPYNLSSKVLSWIIDKHMEAVLCLQEEFVDHMRALPNTGRYTNLSVFCSLFLSIEEIARVPASYFKPVPKVASKVVHIRIKDSGVDKEAMRIIAQIMAHKKKRLKNAVMGSRKALGLDKEAINRLLGGLPNAESRPFQLQPRSILESAKYIKDSIKGSNSDKPEATQNGE